MPLAVAADRLTEVGTDTVPVIAPQVAVLYTSYAIVPLAVAPETQQLGIHGFGLAPLSAVRGGARRLCHFGLGPRSGRFA